MFRKKRLKFILKLVLLSPIAMLLLPEPWGSINPLDYGFWYSILLTVIAGLSSNYTVNFIFRKHGTNYRKKKDF